MAKPSPAIKTRILILSDTHGERSLESHTKDMVADVVIHCGDLTEESKLDEYKSSLRLLQGIKAPLKLVIAGNHDFTLDTPAFQRILQSSALNLDHDQQTLHREYGSFGQAEELITHAADSGIQLLHEGTHEFILENGASLRVYASPFTPSATATWGFQYKPLAEPLSPDLSSFPNDGHAWAIPRDIDIAITHSPPHGVFDRTYDAKRAGSKGLFEAVEWARPRIHCFGHIHESWGAKMVAWRNETSDGGRQEPAASHLTHIDNDRSTLVESLSTLQPGRLDTHDVAAAKERRLLRYQELRACETGCEEESRGEKTLFINASIQGEVQGVYTPQLPWVVNMGLSKAQSSRID